MGIREEFLKQVDEWWETADRNAADAEKWRELDRELEERGYGIMSPAQIVSLIVPKEVVDTLRDWLAAQAPKDGPASDGGNGHSGASVDFPWRIPRCLVTGVTTGAGTCWAHEASTNWVASISTIPGTWNIREDRDERIADVVAG